MNFVALLYEGLGQKLVRCQAANEAEFFAKLNEQYGCYVCLWFSVEPIMSDEEIPAQNPV